MINVIFSKASHTQYTDKDTPVHRHTDTYSKEMRHANDAYTVCLQSQLSEKNVMNYHTEQMITKHRHKTTEKLTYRKNKKFELMLMRHAKAYSSSCSQIALLYLQPFRRNSLLKCAPQPKIANINKTINFGSSRSFKVINVDTTKKLVTSACCDRQHANAYLQPLS